MSEVAHIFRQFGPAYRDKYSEHMLLSHLAVMQAIEACRTEALGGQVYHCATCIVKVEDGKVTFTYREGDTRRRRITTVTAEEFIRRFLQHVLPKGFVKVRYYGLLAPGNRHRLRQVQALLGAQAQPGLPSATSEQSTEQTAQDHTVLCPRCGQPMQVVQSIRPTAQRPALPVQAKARPAQNCSP